VDFLPVQKYVPSSMRNPGRVVVQFQQKGETVHKIEVPVPIRTMANVFIAPSRFLVLVVEVRE
jgi:hypothetical protein